MEKINYLHNGQWALSKSNQLFKESGETHEVEVHPDMDHLYRLKDTINRSGKPHMTVKDIERTGLFNKILSRVPRDASGRVTPQMIDDHISKLPKQKFILKTNPYTWSAQMHHPAANEHVVSVHMHPDNKYDLPTDQVNAISALLHDQHHLSNFNNSAPIGWARIDHSKDNHWHLDELQSDFQHKKKIDDKLKNLRVSAYTKTSRDIDNAIASDPNHPLNIDTQTGEITPEQHHERRNELIKPEFEKLMSFLENNLPKDKNGQHSPKDIHKFLSHGFDDPQHLIHSAINALARKKGIGSMSMDTPEDQAKSSGLLRDAGEDTGGENNERLREYYAFAHPQHWQMQLEQLENGSHPSLRNPNFKSALDKIGIDGLTALANRSVGTGDFIDTREHAFYLAEEGDPEGLRISNEVNKMSEPEIHALDEMMLGHLDIIDSSYPGRSSKVFDPSNMPVHFRDTYINRPKEAGYQLLPKRNILGVGEDNQQVQFAPVYKTINKLRDKLNKIKRI